MGRHLRHAPTRTGGANTSFFTTEGKYHLVWPAVTAKTNNAVGHNTAFQVGVEFFLDVIGQAFGSEIGREGGQKRLGMIGDEGRSETRPGRGRFR